MNPRQIFHAPVWGNPKAMSSELRAIHKVFGEDSDDQPSKDLLQASLIRFADSRTVASFNELKYVCHGVTVPIGTIGIPLIKRTDLFRGLLNEVDGWQDRPKQFRRCYQGLLGGYFGFDLNDQSAEHSAKENWLELRAFLDRRLDGVVRASKARGVASPWLDTLGQHRNLLHDQPCERYAQALHRGDTTELQALCAGLGIASTSWVWDEALMAYVRSVVTLEDDWAFKRDFEGILRLVNGMTALRLPDTLAVKATGLAVVRYRRCYDTPEHGDLRDTSVRLIGNPWVQQVAWAAHVGDEPARQMVERWLKRGLIKDFFSLLAHDGAADTRRLDYWLKWESSITDMWFVLGDYARKNTSTQFMDLKKRMEGRRLALDDADDVNNAFVMRIGPLLVVEFGVTNNACFVYAASEYPGDLNRPRQSIRVLKHRSHPGLLKKLSHNHHWESRFDAALRDLLQQTPASKGVMRQAPAAVASTAATASTVPVSPSGSASGSRRGEPIARHEPATNSISASPLEFDTLIDKIKAGCERHGLAFEDNLDKSGGAFWVLMRDPLYRLGFGRLLQAHGFKFAEGKGFWIKRT